MLEPPSTSGFPSEQRREPRRVLNLPASVKISTYDRTIPFDIKEARICDASESGVGVSVTVETAVTRSEIMKIIARRRGCYLTCLLPGNTSPTRLFGNIVWITPTVTPKGTKIAFGVALDRDFKGNQIDDLKNYLRALDSGKTA